MLIFAVIVLAAIVVLATTLWISDIPATVEQFPNMDAVHAEKAENQLDDSALLAGDFPVTSAQSNNSAFRFLSTEELVQIDPAVQFRYFRGEDDGSYNRHTVVDVDTEDLKGQLRQAWLDAEESGEDSFVEISIFEGESIAISVNSWIGHDSGVTGAYGTAIVDGVEIPDGMRVYFSPSGQMELTINARSENYRLTSVRDFQTYIVMATKPITRFD